MGSVLLFLYLLMLPIYGQDKPKAILFDEFGKISQKELAKRVSSFDKRLRKNAWSENYENAVIFFYCENARDCRQAEASIIKLLGDNCRDCRGWNVRITFVRAGTVRKRKIQLWIVPQGADDPTP